ncbi:hypothetical protein CQ017_06760 [Arthrobacter sp. MYb224]|nr:HNH endonuclease signature motif containing protein [Arthrobacter sp. MYb224]PQZ99372.1 hypothetical protein CQ017_06760 [Arthrobacter sp. MYb224]
MNTTALGDTLSQLDRELTELTGPAAAASPSLAGTDLRALFTGTTQLLSTLREHLAGTEDPRLALELASAGQALADEAARLRVAAADRIAATNAHTLHPDELDALRTTGADTTRDAQRCTGRPSFLDPAALLASWLHLPYTEAAALIQDASDLIGRRNPAGQSVPPRFTHLGALFTTPDPDRTPVLHPSLVQETSRKLAKREPKDLTFEGTGTEPTLRHTDGRAVEEHAADVLRGAQSVKEAEKHVTKLISSAATTPGTATKASVRRGLYALPVRNALSREFLLRVSTLEGEVLDSLIAQANNPRTRVGQAVRTNPGDPAPSHDEAEASGTIDPTSSERNSTDEDEDVAGAVDPSILEPAVPEATTEPNTASSGLPDFLPEGVGNEARWDPEETETIATVPERALNALLDILTTTTGGGSRIRPEVIVHLKLENLQDLAAGDARTAHGVHLPPGELRRLLCQAEIIPAVFNSKSELLDYGRAQRIVPVKLKRAVLARDGGCIVPGCTEPPEKVEFHHIDPWWLGGETKLGNLGALCRGAHMDADAGRIQVVLVDGLPHVILPKHVDPEQQPRRNTYWD